MPAFDLAEQTATLTRFDIVGEHFETPPGFVKHVALLNTDDLEVSFADIVDVVHMGPPLATDGKVIAHVAGRIPLTVSEMKIVRVWIEKIKREYTARGVWNDKRQQYVIRPQWQDRRDPNTGIVRYRRYSCAGFVLDAYRQVRVSLLVTHEGSLPEVTKETLEDVYPGTFRLPKPLLADLGLQGNGPWRVVLAGYVLHALDRSSDEVRTEPYLAQGGDEFF